MLTAWSHHLSFLSDFTNYVSVRTQLLVGQRWRFNAEDSIGESRFSVRPCSLEGFQTICLSYSEGFCDGNNVVVQLQLYVMMHPGFVQSSP